MSQVSIILPVYNTPTELLAQSMNSVLSQSHRDIEVVLVDDGSEENCAAECDYFADIDSRVTVIHQKNAGVSSARNAGIEVTTAPWVMFVDPDDEILPGALEEAVRIAEQEELDVLYATVIDVRMGHPEKRRRMGFDSKTPLRVSDDPRFIRKLAEYFVSWEVPAGSKIPKALSTGPVSRLFSRETIGVVRFDPLLTILEDAIFNSEVVQNSKRVGLLDKPWYLYRRNPGSALRTMDFCTLKRAQVDAVKEYTVRSGIAVDAYYSWLCSYFFMAISSSLIPRGELNYLKLKEGYNIPWFNEAFHRIDRSHFEYETRGAICRYALACSGLIALLYAYYCMVMLRERISLASVNL